MLFQTGIGEALTHSSAGLHPEVAATGKETVHGPTPGIVSVAPSGRKPHAPLGHPLVKVLSGFSFGVAAARCCTLNAVAEAVPVLGKHDTVERRLQRFLANPRLDWAQCCQALAAWVLGRLSGRGPVVLLVDETSLQARLKVMAVSLAYRGRAIPLAWWCYPQARWPMGQVELITTLLTWVATGIAKRRVVLVQADRGIGTSPELLRAIDRLGWYYLVRVTKQVRVQVDAQAPVPFTQFVPQPGTAWHGQVAAFKKAGWPPPRLTRVGFL